MAGPGYSSEIGRCLDAKEGASPGTTAVFPVKYEIGPQLTRGMGPEEKGQGRVQEKGWGQNRGQWVITGAVARAPGVWEDRWRFFQVWKGTWGWAVQAYTVSEKDFWAEHVHRRGPELGETG